MLRARLPHFRTCGRDPEWFHLPRRSQRLRVWHLHGREPPFLLRPYFGGGQELCQIRIDLINHSKSLFSKLKHKDHGASPRPFVSITLNNPAGPDGLLPG